MSKFPNNVGKINPADMWFLLRLIPPWWSLMMPIQAHLQYRISRRFICKIYIYEIFIECLISIAWDHCNKFSKQISISDPCQTMWIPCLAGGVWCRCCDRPRQTFSHLSRAKLFILFGNTWNDFPRFQLVSLVQRHTHTHSYTLMHAWGDLSTKRGIYQWEPWIGSGWSMLHGVTCMCIYTIIYI